MKRLAGILLATLLGFGTARAETITLYSRLADAPAIAHAFTAKTGIKIRLRRPPPAGLGDRILREGDHPRWTLAWFHGEALARRLDRHGLLTRHLPMPPGIPPGFAPANGSAVPTGAMPGAALLVAKSAPFPLPATWTALTDPAYRGLVGMVDPATSDQAAGAVAALFAAGGGWPEAKPFLRALKRDGLHIYADTATTIAALRSGAIQLAIIRATAAKRAAKADKSLRVIAPTPVTTMPNLIVMAKHLAPARRRAAEAFIAYAAGTAAHTLATAPPPAPMPNAMTAWFVSSIVGPSL